jgi:hypothetical protein
VDKKTNNKIMTGMEAGKQATEQQKKEQVIHARTTGERESYRTYWSRSVPSYSYSNTDIIQDDILIY